jgi:nitroreductase
MQGRARDGIARLARRPRTVVARTDSDTSRTAVTPTPEQIALVDAAITTRRSLRAFLPTPVPRETVEHILAVASRAPSGTNTQPWKVYVLTGKSKTALSDKIVAAFNDPAERARHSDEYAYYPTEWKSPFIDRRRKVGWDLYGLLGIDKSDKAGMHAQHRRNYEFFGAPVGLMFTIDRMMQQGSWLDYGMFLQSIMVAARARGLDTCPQAAFMQFHRIISEHVGAPDNEQVVCGMSLGWADPAAVENTLVTEREPVSSFARFLA